MKKMVACPLGDDILQRSRQKAANSLIRVGERSLPQDPQLAGRAISGIKRAEVAIACIAAPVMHVM